MLISVLFDLTWSDLGDFGHEILVLLAVEGFRLGKLVVVASVPKSIRAIMTHISPVMTAMNGVAGSILFIHIRLSLQAKKEQSFESHAAK